MEKFEQNVMGKVESVTRKHVHELCVVWIKLFGHENEDALLMQLEAHYSDFLQNIIGQNLKTQSKLLERYKSICNTRDVIEGQLNDKINLPDANEKPLYHLIKESGRIVEVFRDKLRQRCEEVKKLREDELALCKELGELQSESLPSKMPSKCEIDKIRSHLNYLREIKAKRSKIIEKYHKDIGQMMETLGINEQENLKLIGSDYKMETVSRLETLYFELLETHAKMSVQVDEINVRLQSLWKELNVPEDHQILFQYDSRDCIKANHDKLKAELDRCEKLKVEKYPELIESLRSEIIDFSHKCMKGDKFRGQSTAFEVLVYDEHMLRKHQIELVQLKMLFLQYRETFKLISNRDQLKSQMENFLRNQTESKSRFNNRGGQLLKEEQGRKALERELLQTEIAICKAIDEWQAKNNAPLCAFDEIVVADRSAKARLAMKKQRSTKDFCLRQPLGDSNSNSK